MKKRVLIADDSAAVRDVLRNFLSQMPEVEICGEAVNGLDAIEKAGQLQPHLILLDLAMPDMNGAEVASVLKKKMPDIRIILFTMYDENIGRSLTSAVGVDVVLSKPEGMNQVIEAIRNLLAD